MRGGRAAAAAPWLFTSGIAMIVVVTPANISGNQTFRMVALMLWSLCFVGLGLAVRRLAAGRTAFTTPEFEGVPGS